MALGVTVDFNARLGNISGQIDTINANLNRFQQHAETVSSRVNSAFGALGVGLSAAGIVSFVKSGIDAADALNDMADRTGIAVEKLAGFQLATKLADTDMESFAGAINKLSVNIGKSGDDFAKLGITAKDPAEAFLQLADVMRGIDDPQQRAALGAKALGKSWADMAPLLLQGSDALREQIKQGQAFSGVTTESAQAAAKFNDEIDTLGVGLKSFAMIIAKDVVPWAQRLLEQLGVVPESLNTINNKIAHQQKKLSVMKNEGAAGSLVDGLLGYDPAEEQRKLDVLLGIKGKLTAAEAEQAATKVAVKQSSVTEFIGGGAAGDKKTTEISNEQKAINSLNSEYENLLGSMQKEVALRGDNSNVAKTEYDVIYGSLSKLNESQKLKLLNLAAEKDAIELNTKAYEEYDQIISDGLVLANKQRDAMSAEQTRLSQKFDAPRLDLNAGISDAMDARASGIIPDDVALKKVLDKMGQDYNSLTDDSKRATDQMSEYAVQAAHNMQTAFADFLFDPFKSGTDGMAANFLTTLQHMAADAASAQIMESLFGKSNSSKSLTGGLLGGAMSGLGGLFSGSTGAAFNGSGMLSSFSNTAGLFSGIFHDGGIVGEAGAGRSVHPAIFSGAPRYHAGGIAGLSANEVPAILQRGELVISNKQLANSKSSGSSEVSITTNVNVSGGNSSDNKNMQALGGLINARVREIIMTEKRPNGLLA